MKICSAKNCPCLATHGNECAAHASIATWLPVNKLLPPVFCARCGDEIKQGSFVKPAFGGKVHAGYVCEKKEESRK